MPLTLGEALSKTSKIREGLPNIVDVANLLLVSPHVIQEAIRNAGLELSKSIHNPLPVELETVYVIATLVFVIEGFYYLLRKEKVVATKEFLLAILSVALLILANSDHASQLIDFYEQATWKIIAAASSGVMLYLITSLINEMKKSLQIHEAQGVVAEENTAKD